MFEPISQLTQEDKDTIKDFIYEYVDSEVSDVNSVLKYWNKNNKTLWKALGKNLRVKIPIELNKTEKMKQKLLTTIYSPFIYIDSGAAEKARREEKVAESFMNNYFLYFYSLYKKYEILKEDFQAINWILSYRNVSSGYIDKIDCQKFSYSLDHFVFYNKNKDKKLCIKNGAKTVKTLQKILNFFDYPRMDLFEVFRNKLSDLTTASKIKSTLVFSIHPIDFMTMSDNNCNWSSCMSFVKNGAYSSGPIEMMNSNIVLLAYLESNSKYIFNNHIIPNKSWRTLIYLHKDIMLVGNHYPYTNTDLSYYILNILSKIVKKNLNWNYQFKNQRYKDLFHFKDNDDLINYYYDKANTHSIIIYTNNMYNDLIAYKDNSYICYRNKPKKALFLNASGPLTCLHCGEKFSSYTENIKVCKKCKEKYYCDACKKYHSSDKELYSFKKDFNNFKILVCKDSLKDYWYDRTTNLIINKDLMNDFKKKNMIPVIVFKDIEDLKLIKEKIKIELNNELDKENFKYKEIFSCFNIETIKPQYIIKDLVFEDNARNRCYITDTLFFYGFTEEEIKNRKLSLIPLIEMEELNEHLCSNSNSI